MGLGSLSLREEDEPTDWAGSEKYMGHLPGLPILTIPSSEKVEKEEAPAHDSH